MNFTFGVNFKEWEVRSEGGNDCLLINMVKCGFDEWYCAICPINLRSILYR